MQREHCKPSQRGNAAWLQLQRPPERGARRVQLPQAEGGGTDAKAHLRRRARVLPQRLAEAAWIQGNVFMLCSSAAV